MKKLMAILSTLVVVSFLLVGCGAKATPTAAPAANTNLEAVVAEGHVTPSEDIKLIFPARARIGEILVSEGQHVMKGDVLVRQVEDEQARAVYTAANLELVQAQQALDEFLRTTDLESAKAFAAYQAAQITRATAQKDWEAIDPNKIKDDIDTAQTDVQDKKKALDDANDTLKKYLDLKSDNTTRRLAEADVRKAEADYNTALRKVEELQRSIDEPRAALDAAIAAEAEAKRTFENTSNNTPDPDKKAILEAQLENAKAQAAAAENTLSNYELKAPFEGVVTDVNVSVGELVGSEKFAIQMADTSKWFVETSDLTELEVVKVSVGQAVDIVPDALPDLTLKGTVESISDSYKSQGGDILYKVVIKLDYDQRLRWGMTVQATFAQGTK